MLKTIRLLLGAALLALAGLVHALTPAQLQQLKTELTTDPTALGYAGSSDSQAADKLNLPRATIQIKRTNVMPSELLEVIDERDFEPVIDSGHLELFNALMMQARGIRLVNDDGTDTRSLGNLRRLFQNPGPQGTRARLTDVAFRDGSRAEQLFGRGVVVTHLEVAAARALP